MPNQRKINVFSDYICPFCYIGTLRILRLKAEFKLEVRWLNLEIHPTTPAAGMPIEALGYPSHIWQQLMESLTAMAAEEGLKIAERNFTTNSHKALLLAEAAKSEGDKIFYQLHQRLFEAFFIEQLNIGNASILRDIARSCGLSQNKIEEAWQDTRFENNLKKFRHRAAALNIRGVPAYIFGKQMISGPRSIDPLRAAAQRLVGNT